MAALVFAYKFFVEIYKNSEDRSKVMTLSDNDLSGEILNNPGIINHNRLTEITEIILQNSLGEELAFNRPN